MNTETIKTLWASGFVNRWHSHPDPRLRNAQDTTAAHSQRVAILVMMLGPVADTEERQSNVFHDLRAALLHDAPECFTGDVPAGAKRYQEVLEGDILPLALENLESVWWETTGLPDVFISPLVKLCDLLDAIMFVRHVAPDLLEREDWRTDISKAYGQAATLGFDLSVISGLIHG